MTFTTTTRFDVAEARRLVARLCEHLVEHGVQIRPDADGIVITGDRASARVLAEDAAIAISARSADPEGLREIKQVLIGHLLEFHHGPPLAIRWQGDAGDVVRPPTFRLLTVSRVNPIGPTMLRVRFTGEDLARYDVDEHWHCRLMLPAPGGGETAWPVLGEDGTMGFPATGRRPDVRTYTIRRIDAEAGWLEVDFVLHDIAGPGADWARNARPGDVIGIGGPGGQHVRRADWTLLAGDETALPAIARALETMPRDARGVVILAVDPATGQLDLAAPGGVEIRWLIGGAGSASATPLADAVQALDWPTGETSVFAWAGCEFDEFRRIRRHLRESLGLATADHLVVSYWRRGFREREAPRDASASTSGVD